MDRSYATCVRYLRLLIARARTLSDRSRETKEDELLRLKRGALVCLALLGPDVEKLYRQATQLDFYTSFSGGRFGRKILLDHHAYATLDQLLFLLRAALKKVQHRPVTIQPPVPTPVPTTRQPDPSPDRKRSLPYSPADDCVFRLVERETFSVLTNAELGRRYRRKAEKELQRLMSQNAFRASLNRIRKHHGLPESRKIRKK